MFSDLLINVYQLWGKELLSSTLHTFEVNVTIHFSNIRPKLKFEFQNWYDCLLLLVIQWNPTSLLIFTVLDYNRTHNFLSRTGGTIVKLLYSCNIEPDLYMTDQISIGKIYNVHELEFCFNVLVYLVIYMLQIFNHFWQFVGVIA